MSELILLLDGNRGIYIPKTFIYRYYPTSTTGISEEDSKILLQGPDHDAYWEVWDDVLNNGRFLDSNGIEYTIYHNDDLFAVPPDYEWPEE